MKILNFVLMLVFPIGAIAAPIQSSSQSATSVDEVRTKMPSALRLGIIGSYVVTPPLSGYENTKDKDKGAGFAAVMAGIGNGALSLEAGAGVLKTSEVAILPEHRYLVNSQYYAFPVWAKYNYIERPLSSFFVKGGLMPVTLFRQDSAVENVSSEKNSLLAVAGIGGTAALTSSLAFVLDITAFQNLGGPDKLGVENRGIPRQFVTLGAGLSLDL